MKVNFFVISLFLQTQAFAQMNESPNEFILPITPDFQVNENAGSSNQLLPSAAQGADGIITAVWVDERNGLRRDIYAQAVSSSGEITGENYSITDLELPAKISRVQIAALPEGGYFLAWSDTVLNKYAVFIGKLDNFGQPEGEIIQISGEGENSGEPSVSCGDSTFAVSWTQSGLGLFGADVFISFFNFDGSIFAPVQKVNSVQQTNIISSTAIGKNGTALTVWQNSDNNFNQVFAQIFDSLGNKVEENFLISDSTENSGMPNVAALPSGGFCVSWTVLINGFGRISARFFGPDGTPSTNVFIVSDSDFYAYFPKSAAADNAISFVWTEAESEMRSVYYRKFGFDGDPLGGKLKVNSLSGNAQNPEIFDAGQNKMGVVFQATAGKEDVFLQFIDENGSISGQNIKLNDDAGSGNQYYSSIGLNNSGEFMISWINEEDMSVRGQIFGADGIPAGLNFSINEAAYSASNITYPQVSPLGENYFVSWTTLSSARNYNYYGQIIDQSGTPIDDNFRINREENIPPTPYFHEASNQNGKILTVWNNLNIWGQIFNSDGSFSGENFKVAADSMNCKKPRAAADDEGNFIAAWLIYGNKIGAQKISYSGNLIGENKIIYSDPDPAIFTAPAGGNSGTTLIAWMIIDAWTHVIQARLFDRDLTPISEPVEIRRLAALPDVQSPFSVSGDLNGKFYFVWSEGSGVLAKRFDAVSGVLDSVLSVTETAFSEQHYVDAVLQDGKIYNTWTENRIEGTGLSIWANVLGWDELSQVNYAEHESENKFVLYQNYPNPFNAATTIKYSIQARFVKQSSFFQPVTIKLYDILGNEIAVLVDEKQPAGNYQVSFDANKLSSGVYFYKLNIGEYSDIKKMTVLK